ncbi:2Fe-2S iron-sulfur cluster binding domain-containing protein [Gordonia sp. SID5947]|uniref:PDR/VanB family oxidoreductase n=1 Tax=Gordonia sp. SID5947 TaxID=2690315 RepID=UPI001367E7CD|nr:PDR/VanB family oxidoreductase [Gordonia sp. SID5947]MYR07316.1 2Fe-2S iron-sulfur cluster binding domain-containing protein [Gordonia sp. SID5947]
MKLVVTSVVDTAGGVREITFAAPDGAELPGFVPGSHLVVTAGERTNAYSVTSDGVAPTHYSISVLRVAEGNGGSRWMHDRVSIGDVIDVESPRSAFAPAARAGKHLFFAGGIGVTPIVSHLRAARRWGRDVQVLYVFREGHAAHIDDVVDLAGRDAELFIDRESFAIRLAQVLADQPVGTHMYACGPVGMIDTVVESAAALGWPQSRIHVERFGADALEAGDRFAVRLTESSATLDIPSGTSVLEALEDHGMSIPNRCRQGVCGECRLPLSGGTPVHRDLYLTDEEKRAGDAFMPCVSRASEGCTLEVPL